MSRVAEMHSLTKDLARSYEERMADLSARRVEVKSALQDTSQWMAEQHAARMEASVVLHHNLSEDKAARSSAVERALASMTRDRAKTAAGQAKALAKATADRREVVKHMLADTCSAIRLVHAGRVADEAALQAELRHGRADLFEEVANLMGAIHQDRATMSAAQRRALGRDRAHQEADTASFLVATRDARSAMAKSQRATLEADRAALQAGVSATLGGFHASRVELAEDLAQFSRTWQDFTVAMQNLRAGVAPGPPPPKTKAKPGPPPPKTVAKPAPPPPAAEPVSVTEVREVPSDEAVFGYLADHPDGVRLVELEAHFSTPRIRLVPIVTRLIEENKARKDDALKLYFAT